MNEQLERFWNDLGYLREHLNEPFKADNDSAFVIRTKPGRTFGKAFWEVFQAPQRCFQIHSIVYRNIGRIFELRWIVKNS